MMQALIDRFLLWLRLRTNEADGRWCKSPAERREIERTVARLMGRVPE